MPQAAAPILCARPSACFLLLLLLVFAAPATWAQQPDAAPVNPDTIPAARALLRELDGISGKATLSGEHNYPGAVSSFSDRILDLTGKFPTIFGQDFGFAGGEDKDSTLSRAAMIQEVIRQYRNGAIPALCWHAVPPTEDEPVTFRGSILSSITDWEFQQLLTPGTPLHHRWERQADRVAGYLRDLQDAGVPVLFRPYHEMNGNWFWWGGRPGPNGTAALYRMIFDRYVHVHHLNNLLWVWNVNAPSSNAGAPDLYWPGPGYADVLAMDIYGPYRQSDYNSMVTLAGSHKPIALAEVGTLPTLQVLAQQPRWTYLMIWSGFAEEHNPPELLQSIFHAPNIVNRGDARLAAPLPAPPATPVPRNLQATAAAHALLASLQEAKPRITEIDLANITPQALAASLQRLHEAGQVALLRWSPPSPTGKSSRPLSDFEWTELRRSGSSLHAAWRAQIDALAPLLQRSQGTGVLFSPLPGGNGKSWWSHPGFEGSQALAREVHQRLAPLHLNDLLWVWEPSAAVGSDSPAATFETTFPGPLYVDVYLLDGSTDAAITDPMLHGLRLISAGRPVGLRAAGPNPASHVPYDFLVLPSAPATALLHPRAGPGEQAVP